MRPLLSVVIVLALAAQAIGQGQQTETECGPDGCRTVQASGGQWRVLKEQPRRFSLASPLRQAQAPVRQRFISGVCRIIAEKRVRRGGQWVIERSIGSGVLVLKKSKGLVLTCFHLFRDRPDRVIVEFPNGERYEAENVQVEESTDLGAVTIPLPSVEPVPIQMEGHPKLGDKVTLYGASGSGSNIALPVEVNNYVRFNTADSPLNVLETTGNASFGMSGGPIIDQHGEVVAIIASSKDGLTQGTYSSFLRQFLETGISLPWSGTDKIAPWNARTQQAKIHAAGIVQAAGVTAKAAVDAAQIKAANQGPLPILQPAGGCAAVDSTARGMAQEALTRVAAMEPFVVGLADDTEAATAKAEEATEEVSNVKTGIVATVKAYAWNLAKSYGLSGGLIGAGVFALGFWFLRSRFMIIAQIFDLITDYIPGTRDDKYLDPKVYALMSKLSGKPIPAHAYTPGVNPWGKPYENQPAAPAPPQPVVAPPVDVAALQAELAALKAKQPA